MLNFIIAYALSAAFNVFKSTESGRDSKYNSSPNLAKTCIVLPKTRDDYSVRKKIKVYLNSLQKLKKRKYKPLAFGPGT